MIGKESAQSIQKLLLGRFYKFCISLSGLLRMVFERLREILKSSGVYTSYASSLRSPLLSCFWWTSSQCQVNKLSYLSWCCERGSSFFKTAGDFFGIFGFSGSGAGGIPLKSCMVSLGLTKEGPSSFVLFSFSYISTLYPRPSFLLCSDSFRTCASGFLAR